MDKIDMVSTLTELMNSTKLYKLELFYEKNLKEFKKLKEEKANKEKDSCANSSWIEYTCLLYNILLTLCLGLDIKNCTIYMCAFMLLSSDMLMVAE